MWRKGFHFLWVQSRHRIVTMSLLPGNSLLSWLLEAWQVDFWRTASLLTSTTDKLRSRPPWRVVSGVFMSQTYGLCLSMPNLHWSHRRVEPQFEVRVGLSSVSSACNCDVGTPFLKGNVSHSDDSHGNLQRGEAGPCWDLFMCVRHFCRKQQHLLTLKNPWLY